VAARRGAGVHAFAAEGRERDGVEGRVERRRGQRRHVHPQPRGHREVRHGRGRARAKKSGVPAASAAGLAKSQIPIEAGKNTFRKWMNSLWVPTVTAWRPNGIVRLSVTSTTR